jgi:hypothetical protein
MRIEEVTLRGRIKEFRKNNAIAVVKTDDGEALLDTCMLWSLYGLKIDDEIHIHGGNISLKNGQFLTCAGEGMLRINDILIDKKK